MTPAEVFREAINEKCVELGYKVFVYHMPDKPDNAVCVHDTQFGRLEERRMRTGEVDSFPVVRVVVRGLDHTASEVLPTLWTEVLRDLHSLPVGSDKILKQTTPNNTMVSVGHEPQTRRTLFSQQFRMCIE